ncbi:MAG: PAS domain S-box protein [Flavobacterium sp.]
MHQDNKDFTENYFSLFQSHPFPTYIWKLKDNQFILKEINQAVYQTLGSKAETLLGICAKDLYYDNLSIVDKMHQCLKNHSNFQEELEYFYKTIQQAKFIRAFYIFVDEETLVIQTEEITSQKIAEKKLTEHNQLLKNFINNSPAALAMLDTEYKYLAVSDKWIKDYQLEGKNIIGMSHYEVFPEIGEEWKQIHINCMKGIPASNDEDLFIRENYSEQWLRWEVRPWYNQNQQIGGLIMFTEDITVSKISEKELKASEQRFQKLANNTIVGTFIYKNGKFTYFNEALAKVFAYDINEFQYLSFNDLVSSTDLPLFETILNVKKNEDFKSTQFEFSGKQKNGSEVYLEIFCSTIEINHQNALIGTIIDITTKKSALLELEKSKNKFYQILQDIPVGLVIDNQIEQTLFYNKTFIQMFGYQPEDIPNIDVWWEKAYPDIIYRKHIQEEWKRITEDALLKQTVSEPILAFIRCKDGSDKFAEGFFTKIGEEYITVFQDITDLKNKEMTLQTFNEQIVLQKEAIEKAKLIIEESETKYKEAQKVAKIGSWETNIDDLKVTWSDQTYEIFDLSPETFSPTHHTFLKYVHPDDQQMVDDAFNASFATNHYNTLQHRIVTATGALKYVEEYWKVNFDANGIPERVFGTCQDITEKKLAELEKSRIMQDLLQRNRDLEQFSYIVSHNLRAPVSNILGINHFLQEENLTDDDKSQWITALNQSVISMDTVIKDLNQILQIKRDVSETKQKVRFSNLLEDVKSSFSTLIREEHIEITSDFSAINEMHCIKSYLYSIFYNLISNSIKYRQPNIETIIEVKSHLVNNQILLTFSDNGLGIDLKGKGAQVFGLYKRFHHHIDGKGVGLYMVKTQVETLGGKISIDSEVNVGTTIKVVFDTN